MQRHEMALVELCILGDDIATNNCISKIYATDDAVYIPTEGDMIGDGGELVPCLDEDTECMLNTIWDDWTDGLPSLVGGEEGNEEKVKVETKKVAPWSSRSSPSGTYVRDPKTGKMVNIDE